MPKRLVEINTDTRLLPGKRYSQYWPVVKDLKPGESFEIEGDPLTRQGIYHLCRRIGWKVKSVRQDNGKFRFLRVK